jgi:hypothetical protein
MAWPLETVEVLYDTKWGNPAVLGDHWRQILLEAADLIERDGHCKDVLDDGQGRHCALGATYLSKDGRPTRMGRAAHLAITHLQDMVGANVPAWNNHPDRTAEDVIATLRKCALED